MRFGVFSRRGWQCCLGQCAAVGLAGLALRRADRSRQVLAWPEQVRGYRCLCGDRCRRGRSSDPGKEAEATRTGCGHPDRLRIRLVSRSERFFPGIQPNSSPMLTSTAGSLSDLRSLDV